MQSVYDLNEFFFILLGHRCCVFGVGGWVGGWSGGVALVSPLSGGSIRLPSLISAVIYLFLYSGKPPDKINIGDAEICFIRIPVYPPHPPPTYMCHWFRIESAPIWQPLSRHLTFPSRHTAPYDNTLNSIKIYYIYIQDLATGMRISKSTSVSNQPLSHTSHHVERLKVIRLQKKMKVNGNHDRSSIDIMLVMSRAVESFKKIWLRFRLRLRLRLRIRLSFFLILSGFFVSFLFMFIKLEIN